MASRSDTDASSTGGSQRTGTAGVDRPDSAPRICVVCQRPIDESTDRTWHGEPVHFECGAELRCGVSLVGPTDE